MSKRFLALATVALTLATASAASAGSCAGNRGSVDQLGRYNGAAVVMRGCDHSYTGGQYGYGHTQRGEMSGRSGTVVIRQSGADTHVDFALRGEGLGLGVDLHDRNTRVEAEIDGRDSGVFVQSRHSGDRFGIVSQGIGNVSKFISTN